MDAKTASMTPPTYDAARLIADHQAGVWRYLRVLGCDSALAEDLTQETFLAVLQKPFKELSPAATASYLRTIAHNLYISYYRRQRKVTATDDIARLEELMQEWTRFAGEDNGENLLELLKSCFQHLTERARLALEMRFNKNAARQDIAAALQLTEDGAKNLMQRAKQQLRSCIESQLK
jgi:RNA polymerase sigma-70 factor (ECF subfamily)